MFIYKTSYLEKFEQIEYTIKKIEPQVKFNPNAKIAFVYFYTPNIFSYAKHSILNILSYAEKHNYSVVRDYCGHGIGTIFHEEALQVLHYGKVGTGLPLEPGMTFTIEPMINAGKHHTKLLNDDWTVVTKDRSLSAQWEHTMAVTEQGVEVLTLRKDERGEVA